MNSLASLGWTADDQAAFEEEYGPECEPARVSEQQKGLYTVWAAAGERPVTLPGRFRHRAESHAEYTAVGDWVAVAGQLIRDVLPRRTALLRKRGLGHTEAQVVAANIDTVFITTSLNQDLNPRRLERYLTLVWESGARPVVVLTKADLCTDVMSRVGDTENASLGVPVHAVCALEGRGLEQLADYLGPAATVALVGSSGVGKSTIVNALAGADIQTVKQIRKDAYRGQHTTTSRQLIRLPGGGLVVDTPGMRELSLWDGSEGVSATFSDIEELGKQCRFRDCGHAAEPGCAVRGAIDNGTLDETRWASYSKLVRELAFLEKKQRQRERIEAKKNRC
ncbi:MAG: ribosome small subunit-dependent GTPase A [Planctomycetota bacterium]